MSLILLILGVATGGAIGTFIRFFISSIVKKVHFKYAHIGTLIVNISGCYFIGFFAIFFTFYLNTFWKDLVITGILGGLTTFSSFTLDFYKLHSENRYLHILQYFIITLIGGAAALLLGIATAHVFHL
ncbi:MAG: CrcB family protein [Fusobacteria bacterium]|nr:CrcB family protein [Fusobacteriota bacterium]